MGLVEGEARRGPSVALLARLCNVGPREVRRRIGGGQDVVVTVAIITRRDVWSDVRFAQSHRFAVAKPPQDAAILEEIAVSA